MSVSLKTYPKAAKILRENLDKMIYIDSDEEELRAAFEVALENLAEMYLVRSVVDDYIEGRATAIEAMIQLVKLTRNGDRG